MLGIRSWSITSEGAISQLKELNLDILGRNVELGKVVISSYVKHYVYLSLCASQNITTIVSVVE